MEVNKFTTVPIESENWNVKNGKSLEFVKNRILSGECMNMDIKNFAKASERKFTYLIDICKPEIKNSFKDNKFDYNIKGNDNDKINLKIIYDPDADFEYFSIASCDCDGTFSFMNDLMAEIFEKLLKCGTYNKMTIPKEVVNNIWDYDVKYTVGNFVLNDEFGDFGTKDKPWMQSRFTVMLPIKCEFIKKEE